VPLHCKYVKQYVYKVITTGRRIQTTTFFQSIQFFQSSNFNCTSARIASHHSNKLGVSGPIFSKSTSSLGTLLPSISSTSIAARAPACSAPFMYPGHHVAVSVPANVTRACGSLMVSPHSAMTPALAEPTGQPPVNGSLAQSSSRYLEAIDYSSGQRTCDKRQCSLTAADSERRGQNIQPILTTRAAAAAAE